MQIWNVCLPHTGTERLQKRSEYFRETSQEEDMAQNSEKVTNYPQEAETSEPLKDLSAGDRADPCA